MKMIDKFKKLFRIKEKVGKNHSTSIRVLDVVIEPAIENIGDLKTTRNHRCRHKTLLVNKKKNIICEIGYIFACRDFDQAEAWNKRGYDYHPIEVIEGAITDIKIGDLFEIVNDYKTPEVHTSSKEELEEIKQQLKSILNSTEK